MPPTTRRCYLILSLSRSIKVMLVVMKKCSTNLVGELVWYDTLMTDEIALEHVRFRAATQEDVDCHIESSLEDEETFKVCVMGKVLRANPTSCKHAD
jgi:hypothetical protein